MSTDNVFDSKGINAFLMDEAGQMPLRFNMGGCKFRWDILKMAHSVGKPYSIEELIKTANDLIDWVNQNEKIIKQ